MSIKKHIFSENIKEIESLIKTKFKNDLKLKFGHHNFPFEIKNIRIKKFKRISARFLLDDRKIEENREINFSRLSESRKIKKDDINLFSFKRENCTLDNLGEIIEYRVEESNQTESCGTCLGMQQITCSMCSGSGKNRCYSCSGQRRVQCSNCFGKGEVSCPSIFGCGGKGYKTEMQGGHEVRRRCTQCNGRGVDPCSRCVSGYITCSICNGNGDLSCNTCHSSGKVNCHTCKAQGSFTRFLSVKSELIEKKNSLIIEGNNSSDHIAQNLISEVYKYEEDFTSYQISLMSDYRQQLKDLFSSFLATNAQEGKMIYTSLDDCASLSFEIILGGSTYLGFLKN